MTDDNTDWQSRAARDVSELESQLAEARGALNRADHHMNLAWTDERTEDTIDLDHFTRAWLVITNALAGQGGGDE